MQSPVPWAVFVLTTGKECKDAQGRWYRPDWCRTRHRPGWRWRRRWTDGWLRGRAGRQLQMPGVRQDSAAPAWCSMFAGKVSLLRRGDDPADVAGAVRLEWEWPVFSDMSWYSA